MGLVESLQVGINYDHRLGELVIAIREKERPDPPVVARVPIHVLLRNLGARAEELRQMMLDAQAPIAPTMDLEALCRQAIPTDLTGKTVLDIGGYDGRFAALCIERGASRAVCIDNAQYDQYVWKKPDPLPGVEYVATDFMEWEEPADLVIFYNVIYHCPEPLVALRHIRRLTRDSALVCSLTRFDDQPRWYLYETRECNPEDPTVYWGPSPSGLKRALEMVGFTEVGEVGKAVERLVLRCR